MDSDIDYAELFGVTPEGEIQKPAREPGGQEPVGPVTDQESAGPAGDPEPAAPEGTEQVPDPEPPRDPSEAGRMELSPRAETEQSRLYSEDQRRAQHEAVIAKAQEDAQRTIDEAFARSGLRNPYTGQPITSKAEYDAYKDQFDAERRDQVLKKTGMSDEEFQRFVRDLPEVRKAREAQEAAEKAQREAREAAARVKIDEQIREIGALDPSIKSLQDLTKMPTYPRFYELVRRGNTFTDAFRLANFDALAQRAAAGGRQAAVNAVRSKEHLEQTMSRGRGAVNVPADVREQYRIFNPDATDEEIQRHYQKNHKEA